MKLIKRNIPKFRIGGKQIIYAEDGVSFNNIVDMYKAQNNGKSLNTKQYERLKNQWDKGDRTYLIQNYNNWQNELDNERTRLINSSKSIKEPTPKSNNTNSKPISEQDASVSFESKNPSKDDIDKIVYDNIRTETAKKSKWKNNAKRANQVFRIEKSKGEYYNFNNVKDVALFQYRNGFRGKDVDGLIGEKTWDLLNKVSNKNIQFNINKSPLQEKNSQENNNSKQTESDKNIEQNKPQESVNQDSTEDLPDNWRDMKFTSVVREENGEIRTEEFDGGLIEDLLMQRDFDKTSIEYFIKKALNDPNNIVDFSEVDAYNSKLAEKNINLTRYRKARGNFIPLKGEGSGYKYVHNNGEHYLSYYDNLIKIPKKYLDKYSDPLTSATHFMDDVESGKFLISGFKPTKLMGNPFLSGMYNNKPLYLNRIGGNRLQLYPDENLENSISMDNNLEFNSMDEVTRFLDDHIKRFGSNSRYFELNPSAAWGKKGETSGYHLYFVGDDKAYIQKDGRTKIYLSRNAVPKQGLTPAVKAALIKFYDEKIKEQNEKGNS